jgi:hypothetical protein
VTDAREEAAPVLLRHAPLFTLYAYRPYPGPARPGSGDGPAAVTAAEQTTVQGLVQAGLAGLAGAVETVCLYRPGPRGDAPRPGDSGGDGWWRCGRLSAAVRQHCCGDTKRRRRQWQRRRRIWCGVTMRTRQHLRGLRT